MRETTHLRTSYKVESYMLDGGASHQSGFLAFSSCCGSPIFPNPTLTQQRKFLSVSEVVWLRNTLRRHIYLNSWSPVVMLLRKFRTSSRCSLTGRNMFLEVNMESLWPCHISCWLLSASITVYSMSSPPFGLSWTCKSNSFFSCFW